MPLAAYSETVAHVFDAVLDDRQTPSALKAVANYVGATGAAYLLVNKLTRRVSTITWWGSFAGGQAEYLAYYSKIDPFRVIQEEAACGVPSRLSDCLPARALRRDEWYNDFILKGGVNDILSTKLYESASHMVIVGLHRATDDTHSVPRDAAAFRTLLGPMRSAACLQVGLISSGFRSAITRSRLDHLRMGVVFTDDSRRIVETNQAGEAILRIGDGLTMRNGEICARRNFETTKLASLIANTAKSGNRLRAGCMLIARDDGQPSYIVRVAPVSAGLAGNDLPMAMVLVSVLHENRVSEGDLAELYGLSPAESRIAIAVADGKSLTALAAEFGLSIATLRTQLSSILRKCEVRRQSDLVRLVLSIPIVQSAPSETENV